jgi:hypothetical protein
VTAALLRVTASGGAPPVGDRGLATVSDAVPRLTGAPAARVVDIDWWPPPGRAS